MQRGWSGGFWLRSALVSHGLKALIAVLMVVASLAAMQPLWPHAYEAGELAQGTLTDTLDGHRVTVEGELPWGARLELASVGDEAAAQILEGAGIKDAASFFAVDITIVDAAGQAWQPAELGAHVTIENLELENPAAVSVLHVLDDAAAISEALAAEAAPAPALAAEAPALTQLTDTALAAELPEAASAAREATGAENAIYLAKLADDLAATENAVSFDATSFSVYIVVEGETHLRTYRFYTLDEYGDYVEYAFYTDAGQTTFTQTIKTGESVVAPQNPLNAQDPTATFAGWYEDVREEGEPDIVFASTPYDFDNIPAVTQDEEVHLYARFASYAYVVFHDQYDEDTETFPVAKTVRLELEGGSATCDIAAYSVSYQGGTDMVFAGWSATSIKNPGATYDDGGYPVSRLESPLTVTQTTHLYPIFESVYWLSYYSGVSGSGATHYAETACVGGLGPTSLGVPTRNDTSYAFIGWYAGATILSDGEAAIDGATKIADENGQLIDGASAEGIRVENGRIVISEDVTIYAGWAQSTTADYVIVILTQVASDEEGIADDSKHYEYFESYVKTGTIGDTVTVEGTDYTQLNDIDAYNRLHPDNPVTDETNPYANYTYNENMTEATTVIGSEDGGFIYVRYDWTEKPSMEGKRFTLTFADTLTGELQSASLPHSESLLYGAVLAPYVPDDPVCGITTAYTFVGWFADSDCTMRAFFDQESYDAYQDNNRVLFETMPGADLTVYAGWEAIKYKVNVDPNYGVLSGTDSTYFNGSYTNRISEYTTVTRDYVESTSGTYYYVKHDRSYYESHAEDPGSASYRKTYYTTDPSEATEFTTFEYKPGVYRYAGWYEVLEDGSEVPYEFDTPVDHDTTIRLHWTKIGAFYLSFDAGLGTIDTDEELEVVYVELDGESYADNAEVVLTRTAEAPEGYEFVGWKIRGDESGKVYYPGQAFTLQTKTAATVLGKRTVYLDAVYTRLATASIVYHANGGVMDPSGVDYGSLPEGATIPGTAFDEDEATYTISGLANNTQVFLSDGSGLTLEGAEFAGWCQNPSYDPSDESAPLLVPGSEFHYNVDTNEPVNLYAVWTVSVSFHLNAAEGDASFGGDWGDGYTYSGGDDPTYTRTAYLGGPLEWPPHDPVYTGSSNLMFSWWSTRSSGGTLTKYDLSQPLEGPLDLYADWGEKAEVTVHAFDSSSTLFQNMDTAWGVSSALAVDEAGIDISEATAAELGWAVPEEYVFAFATVVEAEVAQSGDPQVDANPIVHLSYHPDDNLVYATYESGEVAALDTGDEVFFIYYKEMALNIHYVVMDDDGDLTQVNVSDAAPEISSVMRGESDAFDMAASVTEPLAWANNEYGFYSFAIGDGSGDNNAYNLTFMTAASTTDSERPALLVENSWREFQYTTDGGTTWFNCGYEPDLYVVYYTKQPTIVTFHAQTLGFPTDKLYYYDFDYRIDTYDFDTHEFIGTIWDTSVEGRDPVSLFSDSTYSTILFTDAPGSSPRVTQSVTITLKDIRSIFGGSAKELFTTTVEGVEADEFTYTALDEDELGQTQLVTFVNTRVPESVELHLAKVDVSSGSLALQDDWRSSDAEDYTIELALGQEIDLRDMAASASFAPYADTNYVFGALFFGSETVVGEGAESWTRVDPAPNEYVMNVATIAFEADEPGSTSYNIYLKNAEGDRIGILGDYQLFSLYYPQLTIHYMLEGDNGELTAIGGSDGITYAGEQLTLNGELVRQNQKLRMPIYGLKISQNASDGSFNMPPLLDDGEHLLDLVYDKIGVASQEDSAQQATSTSQLTSTSEAQTLYLSIVNNQLSWSFDGETWDGDVYGGTVADWPVVYAIYRERGYDLTVSKRMSVDTGYTEPFVVTLSSTAISRSSYSVEGTGNATISAIPATGSVPGSISFTVVDGSEIRIYGLGKGSYTLTESENTNFTLSAQVNGTNTSVADNSLSLALSTNTLVSLTNSADYVCQVGTEQFHTISAAIDWIKRNSSELSGTIEMLCDYLQPASDMPVVPEDHDIVLTSAEGHTYTITRKSSFASGDMIENSGTLTLRNIVLDGNGVAAAGSIVGNAGTLVIGNNATLTGGVNLGNGGAVNSSGGSVEVAAGNITGNAASQGGAIYASGGSVTISGGNITGNTAPGDGGALYCAGTESAQVTGGSLSGNSAENGGAIYMSTGSLEVTGGVLSGNVASSQGGALYAANAVITVSDAAIIGGSAASSANEAQRGGGIYVEKGAVQLGGGSIEGNAASQFGGGVYAAQGSVTVSGGSVEGNTAALYGGGIYADTGVVTVSSGSIEANSAAAGGGIYSASGTVTLSGTLSSSVYSTTFENNSATSGNGGGVLVDTGTLVASTVSFSGNTASENGGGVWVGAGSATLTSVSASGNSAKNGAAVFVDEGSAAFDAGSVKTNTATAGGAIGVGNATAKLYFKNNIVVSDNTLTTSSGSVTANVYLDQDTDTVINAQGLGSSASVGIYVPGEYSSELYTNRSMPGSRFAVYTSNSNAAKFKNDRASALSVQSDTSAKKLYWGKALTVEVRYLDSMSASLDTVARGTTRYTLSNYYAPSGTNAMSEIAADVRTKSTTSVGSTTAVFAVAFLGSDNNPSYADYITDVNWNSEASQWEFVKRDGSVVTGTRLIVYYSEPAYITIENNTGHELTVRDLTVYGHTAINTSSQAGYGYVFAVNDNIQDQLYPITAQDLTLAAGKTIKLLFPGGRNAAYVLDGSFAGDAEAIPYTLNGTSAELAATDIADFELTGKTLTATGGTYEIVFGGSRAICKVVASPVSGVSDSEIAGKTNSPDADGNIEYAFASFRQAEAFITKYLNKTATIEMLVDYLVSSSDNVNFPQLSDVTFTTAVDGTYRYTAASEEASSTALRATISRDTDNKESLITVTSGATGTKLSFNNLIFDGKNIGGNINGGIIRTINCDVTVTGCDFKNCVASNGGAMYVNSSSTSAPWCTLTVSSCSFSGCKTNSDKNRDGGGAIWAHVLKLYLTDSSFENCSAVDQAGAVFHRIDGNVANSETKAIRCSFTDCTAKAAGGMECDSKTVYVEDCSFVRCTASARNGGGLNVFALNSAEPTSACSTTLIRCTFDDCHANSQRGGGARSSSLTTTLIDCSATDCTAQLGGGFGLSNPKADSVSYITGCSATNCTASENGGGIYCTNYKLYINTSDDATSGQTTIKGCTAKQGGGIWHGTNASGTIMDAKNITIENCEATAEAGGGIYELARTISFQSVDISGCTTEKQGGGIYVAQADASGVTLALTGCTIKDCSATLAGGGLYHTRTKAAVTLTNCRFERNASGGAGGGAYTDATTPAVSGCAFVGNSAASYGGGLCHNLNNNSAYLVVDGGSVTDNASDARGGGIYTLSNLHLKGSVQITGNSLTTEVAEDAAGVYLTNSRTLRLGTAGAEDKDSTTIAGNHVLGGTASDLRLPMSNSVNSKSVVVYSDLDGEIRVVNAAKRGTQFGASEIEYPYGFSDLFSVFKADDDSLYGILKRSDSTHTQIIWAEEPICKITDASGKLLFIDQNHAYPAVFDQLDNGSVSDTSNTTAFSLLRQATPALYDAQGNLYDGTTYQVKMLVEEYTAEKYITSVENTSRTVIFTTAGTKDSLYPYEGREGTRATVIAGSGVGNSNMFTARFNLTLQNIVLDGGSATDQREAIRTPNGNTRILNLGVQNITVTLGRNAALQNAECTGNGAGVYLSTGNQTLRIEGGAIRNCKAQNGGGIFLNTNTSTVTMTGGSITRCSAVASGTSGGKGGGVYANGAFNMTGGSITRCTAELGGGVYMTNTSKSILTMSGGSISANSANTKGGGIAVEGKNARLNFSGAAYVYTNTSEASVAESKACNVEMDQGFTVSDKNPGTIIHSNGLIRGAAIGVYVPDSGTLYTNHGDEGDPFATYESGTSKNTLHYFINDRNGLKGGLTTDQASDNYKIYWVKIYSLEITNQILSDDPSDTYKKFSYTVTLSGTATGNVAAEDFNGTYGDLTFENGVANFTLENGETKVADLMPLGFGYTVTENISDAEREYYKVTPDTTQTGYMTSADKYVYSVSFVNLHAVCKITDSMYGLLYYESSDGYQPAVYSLLQNAFNGLKTVDYYYKEGDAYMPVSVNTASTHVEMLVDVCELEGGTTVQIGTRAVLTTADPLADDGFPYVGAGAATIARGFDGEALISVKGQLTLGNITLDGRSGSRTALYNGGLMNVSSGAVVTLGTGATLCNSQSAESVSGAGIYLAEGATLNISGAPRFFNNVSLAALADGSQNGGESYTAARQDIFVAGYSEADAASLVVTGDLTAADGSIWVWASEPLHYKQSKQFAVMSGGTHTGLEAFRNARTDADTDNPLYTTPAYLTGVSRDGMVYWTGGSELIVTKTITGRLADYNRVFDFVVDGLEAQESYAWQRTTIDGSTWTPAASVAEASSGTVVADANGRVSFKLRHNEIIRLAVPGDVSLTVTEDPGLYTASYVLDSGSSVTANTTVSLSMAQPHRVDYTNDFSNYADTALVVRTAPYAGLVAVGALLAVGVFLGRRERDGGESLLGRLLLRCAAAQEAHRSPAKHFREGGAKR